MADTVRLIAALKTLLADNTTGAISPQDVRDMLESLAPPEQALVDGANIAWDLDVKPVSRVTLGGNRTITLSNGESGRTYRLAIVQDGIGGRQPTIAGATLRGAANWDTAPNAVSLVGVDVVNGVRYYAVAGA